MLKLGCGDCSDAPTFRAPDPNAQNHLPPAPPTTPLAVGWSPIRMPPVSVLGLEVFWRGRTRQLCALHGAAHECWTPPGWLRSAVAGAMRLWARVCRAVMVGHPAAVQVAVGALGAELAGAPLEHEVAVPGGAGVGPQAPPLGPAVLAAVEGLEEVRVEHALQ